MRSISASATVVPPKRSSSGPESRQETGSGRRGDHVDARPLDGAAGNLGDERRAAPRGLVADLEVGAALEAVRRVGVHAELLRPDPDAAAVEVRALEQHVGGALRHFGVETAHDAGESDGARTVGDDQHLRIELAFLAVERHDLLAGARAPHVDLAAGNGGEIVGVHRLTALPEAEVGGIDDVVDRARADRLEAAHQPLRRRTDLARRGSRARRSAGSPRDRRSARTPADRSAKGFQ